MRAAQRLMPSSGRRRVPPTPPPAVPPTLLLDKVSVSALAAYSLYRKLRSAYAGFAYRVKRDSDGALLDVGFVGDFVDTAALTTFLGSGQGRLWLWYDQGANGNTLSTTIGPAIYSAGLVTIGTFKPAAANFSTNVGVRMFRNDALGLSGAPDITVGQVRQGSSGAGGAVGFMTIGDAVFFSRSSISFYSPASGATGYTIQSYSASTVRVFTGMTPIAPAGGYVYQIAAGASWSAARFRQNGIALSSGATTADGPLGLGNVQLWVGCITQITDVRYNFLAVWNADLGSVDLQALEDEQLLHYA